MLTLEEIRTTAINPDVAREAHAQAQKRLDDTLATKAGHEQKAFALLAAYITAAVALFTVFGVLAGGENHGIAPAFLVTGTVYVLGAILSGIALLPRDYGATGSDPSAWLRRGVLDGDAAALAANLAYETYFHKARIDKGQNANLGKARLIGGALITGLCGLPILAVWVSLSSQ